MKYFYKIVLDEAQVGSGTVIPYGYIEYTKGKEPQELIDALAYQTPEEFKAQAKRDGEDYNGYQIPFMNDDALALMQVKSAFEMGVTSTNIEFTNGTVMPIQAAEFQEFAIWFVNKRNSFFV